MISMSDLDQLDARILLALDDDPDATILSLARALGVARNTVHARLRRLTSSGSLKGFSHRVDVNALGYPLLAFVSLAIAQDAGPAATRALSAIPEVVEIHSTTGDADLLVRVVARDTSDLYRLTNEIVAVDGIIRSSTTISLDEALPMRTRALLEVAAGQRSAAAGGGSDRPGPIVVMGVSGSGKSTVGEALARRLRVPFLDGDDLHPAANVAKMAAGTPLDDHDREPWLDAVGDWLADHEAGAVAACSALRVRYRDRIRARAPRTRFVELGSSENRGLIAERQAARTGHFMPTSLLDSQFATLEPLQPAEAGLRVDVGGGVAAVVERIATWCEPTSTT